MNFDFLSVCNTRSVCFSSYMCRVESVVQLKTCGFITIVLESEVDGWLPVVVDEVAGMPKVSV